jgi:cytochrome P450/NADPH-cytochrome P450 reductase
MLPPLRPRYYSISSSPLHDAHRCSITVAVVAGEARSGRGAFEGVCSNHLLRQGEGSLVQAFVKDTHSAFRLPDDPTTPLIMIGPGTGLAPSAASSRSARPCAHRAGPSAPPSSSSAAGIPEQDFIYQGELRAFAEGGVASLYPCFSRVADRPRVYVQDEVLERTDDVWALLEAGAIVYVCGDATRMAPDVRRAFAAIHRAKTGRDGGQAEAWLDELVERNRYLVDVWASG